MPENEVQILIEGDEAEAAAGELAAIIREELGHEAAPKPVRAEATRKDERIDAGTAIGIATLVLTIPQTILTVMDIADRLKKRKQAEKVIAGAGDVQRKHSGTVIRVRRADGSTVRIETLDGNTLIDIAAGSKS